MFVVNEIHEVDVVDVLRVVDGEDCERFGRFGRSTNENTDVVPERIYKRMERLLSFHFSQQAVVVLEMVAAGCAGDCWGHCCCWGRGCLANCCP